MKIFYFIALMFIVMLLGAQVNSLSVKDKLAKRQVLAKTKADNGFSIKHTGSSFVKKSR